MDEKWTKWEPIAGLAHKYYIDSVSDSIAGFIVLLSDYDDEQKKIKITFKDSVGSYIRTDESFRIKLVQKLKRKYGLDFYGDWTFFKVTGSPYLQWILDQSCGIAESRELVHYSIVASDSVLDIINDYEPIVEHINSK